MVIFVIFLVIWAFRLFVIPMIGELLGSLLVPIVMIAGLLLILAAAGIRLTNNLGNQVVNGIFSAVGWVIRTIIAGFAWLVRNMVRWVPHIFTSIRNGMAGRGMNRILATILAVFFTVAII